MTPWTVTTSDALTWLRSLPDGIAACCVTSPPYWMLRSYLRPDHPQKHLELGQERSPDCHGWATGLPCGECYCCHLVAVFREVRRVLHPTGTLWLNVAGSYANNPGNGRGGETQIGGALPHRSGSKKNPSGWKQKDYVNVPALLAEALRVDGWYLRAEVYLRKVATMPESVRDRVTRASERLYLLAKEPRYYYDAEADRQPLVKPLHAPGNKEKRFDSPTGAQSWTPDRMDKTWGSEAGRNLWDWWNCPPEDEDDCPEPDWEWRPEPEPKTRRKRHFAIMPGFLARRCIRLSSSEHGCCPTCRAPWVRVVDRTKRPRNGQVRPSERDGGVTAEDGLERTGLSHFKYAEWLKANPPQTTGWQPSCTHGLDPVPCLVIDPFVGAGTTGREARRLGRCFQGSELSEEYASLARKRIGEATPLLDAVAEEDDGPQQGGLFDSIPAKEE